MSKLAKLVGCLFLAVGITQNVSAWDDPLAELASQTGTGSEGHDLVTNGSIQNEGEPEKQMIAALRQMEMDWNSGNLDAFLTGYWNNPSFAFVAGTKASHGWKATRQRYLKNYANGLGLVAFSDLKARNISNTAGILFCRWTLDFGDRAVSGMATFVFEKKGEEWTVTHEHASH